MPKRKFLRRFEPRYSVGASMVAEEAKALGREVEDYEVQSTAQLEKWLNERHALCRRCWEELQLLFGHLPERDRRIIHSLLFRDFYHILELYLCHVRTKHPELSVASPSPPIPEKGPDSEFNEWLFEP